MANVINKSSGSPFDPGNGVTGWNKINVNKNRGGNGRAAGAPRPGTLGVQGRTYYPVRPLGPHTGPTAADFPHGQLPTGLPAPAPSTPIPPPVGGALPQSPALTQLWGVIGGGAPIPTSLQNFNTAIRQWLDMLRRQGGLG